MNRSLFRLFIILSFMTPQSNGQDTSAVHWYRAGGIGLLTAGGFVYGHALNTNLWWKGEKSGFHFNWQEDWTYALGSDKFGHFFFPYMASQVYSGLFQWSGFSRNTSLWLGSSLAFSYQTYIEIKDGFSKQWGFSWGDFAANTLGAAYPLIEEEYPPLKNFRFKMSFSPSERFRNNSHSVIFDDYESTYDWVSIDIYNLLPQKAKPYWSPYLNIALGHSVKRLDAPEGGHHELFLALDWNLDAFQIQNEYLRAVQKIIGFYRLPSPAVKIYPGVVWYGIKL